MKFKKIPLFVLTVLLIAMLSACAKMHRMRIYPRKAGKENTPGGGLELPPPEEN